MLFSLENDGSSFLTFKLQVRELKDMNILNFNFLFYYVQLFYVFLYP